VTYSPTGAQRAIGLALAALGSIGIAIALVPLRDSIDNANLGLILVLVVVVSAIVGGWAAGALAAVTATLAFDFFLTRPYLSMRIDSADDIETVVILLGVGLLVGEVAARGRRARELEERTARAIARVHHVARVVSSGAPLGETITVARHELVALLCLQDCFVEFPPFRWSMPALGPGGTIEGEDEHQWAPGGFVLSPDGIEAPVVANGRQVARFVLIGRPAHPVTFEERIVAVAIAAQVGGAIGMADPEDVRSVAAERSPRD
jgi:hypothetical protein